MLVSSVKVILYGLLADEFHEWCCNLARGRIFCRSSGDLVFTLRPPKWAGRENISIEIRLKTEVRRDKKATQ